MEWLWEVKMNTKKLIGYDTCPDCEGSGTVSTDTADLNCPSCLGFGNVAFDKKGYYPYNPDTYRVAEVKTIWKYIALQQKSQLEKDC